MAANQAPPSLRFSRQEHWSGLPSPSPMHEREKWKWSHSVVSNSSDPMDCSLPGSFTRGIFQARVLEWSAIAFFSWHTNYIQMSFQPTKLWEPSFCASHGAKGRKSIFSPASRVWYLSGAILPSFSAWYPQFHYWPPVSSSHFLLPVH